MTNEINENLAKPQSEKKTVYSRLDLSWYLAGAYLDVVRALGNFSRDEEFNRLFTELRNYVDKCFFEQCQGEISEIYVIAEQKLSS